MPEASDRDAAEAAAIDALVRFVATRCGEGFTLRAASVAVETPEGRELSVPLDPVLFYLRCWKRLKPAARHSPDFRSVHWFGADYAGESGFTPLQAAIVSILWEAWENRTPDVGAAYLLDRAGSARSKQRLDAVFHGHPAWGRMIVSRSKGAFRLEAPAQGLFPAA